ncbi:hypothetical protein KM043_007418 [Ampulex compressa]|nr:hypothetical protein KM043_007418 [Ampulex compressa]
MCFGRVPPGGSRQSSENSEAGCPWANGEILDSSSWPSLGAYPAGMGMLLPDETYEERSSSSRRSSCPNVLPELDELDAARALAALRKCDEFLKRHGIRPEFFCRHRERLALQAWLLQRSKLSSGEFYLLTPHLPCLHVGFIGISSGLLGQLTLVS